MIPPPCERSPPRSRPTSPASSVPAPLERIQSPVRQLARPRAYNERVRVSSKWLAVLGVAVVVAIVLLVWRGGGGDRVGESDEVGGAEVGGTGPRGPGLAAVPTAASRATRSVATAGAAESAGAALARGPGRVTVTVRLPGGTPLERALIEVFAPEGAETPQPRFTDARGEAAFADLAACDGFTVRVTPGRSAAGRWFEVTRSVDLSGPPVAAVQVEVPRAGIAGIVLDDDSRIPVPNAVVRAFETESQPSDEEFEDVQAWRKMPERVLATTRSDDVGKFFLDDVGWNVDLEAIAPDGRRTPPDQVLAPRGASTVVGVRRTSPFPVRGRVMDDRRQPVSGATLAFRAQYSHGPPLFTVTADAEGRFSFEATLRTYWVGITTRDGRATLTDRTISEGEEVLIIVPTDTALSFTVTDDTSGEPVAGVRITPWGLFGAHAEGIATNASGKARTPYAAAPLDEIDVQAPGYRPAELQRPDFRSPSVVVAPGTALNSPFAPGEVREVALRMRRGGVVVGRVVLPDGTPADGAEVSCGDSGFTPSRPTTTTGPDGRFRLERMLPSPYEEDRGSVVVRASLAGYDRITRTIDASRLPRDGSELEIGDLVLKRPWVVCSRVIDGDGKPVPGARIDVSGGTTDGLAHTAEDGTFTVDVRSRPVWMPEAEPGLYVWVRADGFLAADVLLERSPAPGSVLRIPPIVLHRPGSVRVRVLNAADRPLPGVSVSVRPAVALTDGQAPPRTDGAGWVAVEGLDWGAGLSLEAPDRTRFHYQRYLDTSEGAKEIVIRLPATRPLEVQVTNEADAPLRATVRVDTWAAGESFADVDPLGVTDDAGTTRFAAIPARPISLTVSLPGFVTREVLVPVDAPPRVKVVLERFGEAHAHRLAAVREEIKELKSRVEDDRDPGDERSKRLRDLEDEERRLTGR